MIRTDPAPGFVRLKNDKLLKHHHLSIEIGYLKNVNKNPGKNPGKNPTAEKAVREVEDELVRLDPVGGPVTALTLSLVTANVNSRIRSRGL